MKSDAFIRAVTVFTSGLPGAPSRRTLSAFTRSSPLRSISTSASAIDATCTAADEIVDEFHERAAARRPEVRDALAHRREHRPDFFQRRGRTAHDEIQLARRRLVLATGHRCVDKFAPAQLRRLRELLHPAHRERAAIDGHRTGRRRARERTVDTEPHRARRDIVRDHAEHHVSRCRRFARRRRYLRAGRSERLRLCTVAIEKP